MTTILTLENPSDELLRAFKNMAKAANVKCKIGKSKEPKYYTLEDSPAIKKIDKWARENPDLAKQARLELEAEMRSYASNPIK
ncbi:hypothetical protein ACWIUD_00250 [Helicobacter sp. 23-1044]